MKQTNKQTFAATEAPGHVDAQVMFVSLDRLEVIAAQNVVATQMHAPCCYAEISHVVRCWAAYAPIESTCTMESIISSQIFLPLV